TRFSRDWSSDVCSSDLRYLYYLELADMQGRVCVDKERQIEIVELFKVMCEDLNVFGCAPKPWLRLADCADINFCDDFVADYVLRSEERRVGNGCRVLMV